MLHLLGELLWKCQSGVGRQVFAFTVINHCSSTFHEFVVVRCCSGFSFWSQGRQKAHQDRENGVSCAFWTAPELEMVHQPWMLHSQGSDPVRSGLGQQEGPRKVSV